MWEQLEKYILEFQKLEISKVLNFEEFNRIAIVHHSSAIEGSTLTLEESTLLMRRIRLRILIGVKKKTRKYSESAQTKTGMVTITICM